MGNLIDLTKKAKITLEKKGINTETEKVNVVLALDISASMSSMFRNGLVQDVVERILGIGLNMDKNKQIEVYLFGRHHHHASNVTEFNYVDYVKREISNKYQLEGSTNYAGVMKSIITDLIGDYDVPAKRSRVFSDSSESKVGFLGKLFGKKPVDVEEEVEVEIDVKSTVSKDATVVFFITDGDNFDQAETERLIKDVSKFSVFWQFVGIGNTTFNFLEKLDDMGGRVIDNANFFQLNDINSISDVELYDRILDEFPSWLKESRSKGITN